jgi:hypothetical protein
MELNPNDLLIVPSWAVVPARLESQSIRIKYLQSPSIVFSSNRGFMNTQSITNQSKITTNFLLGLFGMKTKKPDKKDIFLRHIRILNEETGEFFHNKGATVLIDLKASEGRFLFSYAICNNTDNFNKLIAHNVCQERMDKGYVIECINYDPSISILQNIYLAIGVEDDKYPLTDFDWKDILPELYGTYTQEQRKSLSHLRRLIRDKY